MSDRAAPADDGRTGLTIFLLVAALLAAGGGSALVVLKQDLLAGAATAAAMASLVLAGRAARRIASPRLLFADSAVERIAHAALLAAVARDRLPDEPRVAAVALVALVTSYLASYLRAKAVGLGFDLEESTVDRAVLLGALAAGLMTGYVEAGLWPAVAWSGAVSIKRAVEVSTQGEPG